MRVEIDLPSQIRLSNARDSVDLIVGNGMHCVTVSGDGRIVVQGNGGGAPFFTVNVEEVIEALSRTWSPGHHGS